jgi:hypothetical protein
VITLLACAALAWPAPGAAAAPKTITIAATTPDTGNCFPFGGFLADGGWGPNFAFVYQNIPAFQLKPSDTIAFDLNNIPNDTDIQMDVAMATAGNGTDVNSTPFTTIVRNTTTPASPRGNSVAGDYELVYTSIASFNFAGGGLIIRFSNPAGPFATDGTCGNGEVVGGLEGDSSGFFLSREYFDPDGVAPWAAGDMGPAGNFRLTLQPTSNKLTFGKLKRNAKKGTAVLPVGVPGPGKLALAGKGVKGQTAGARASVKAAGTVKLRVRAKGKKRAALLARGKVGLKLRIKFTPGGDPAGDPRTTRRKVKLIQAD